MLFSLACEMPFKLYRVGTLLFSHLSYFFEALKFLSSLRFTFFLGRSFSPSRFSHESR